MDRNTFMAVILSVIVLTAGFFVQQRFFMTEPEAAQAGTEEPAAVTEDSEAEKSEKPLENSLVPEDAAEDKAGEPQDQSLSGVIKAYRTYPEEEEPKTEIIRQETDVFDITFSTKGAVVKSLKLKEHEDSETGKPVDMIFNPGIQEGAFSLSLGGPGTKALDETFYFEEKGENRWVFSRRYQVKDDTGDWSEPFTIKKEFQFHPGNYLFRISVSFENSVNQYLPLNRPDGAYTLNFGPQLGPAFEKIDRRYSYRNFFAYVNGEKDKVKPKGDLITRDESMLSWGAITGKYFTMIGKPEYSPSTISWSDKARGELPLGGYLYMTRPNIKAARNTDVYEIYLGPKLKRILRRYDNPQQNPYELSNMNFDTLAEGGSILSWLEALLKFILDNIYKVIPNYGIAIILLTVLVKILLFPLTHKSYESTSKMQTINPKMTELREKYKNDTEKLNKEMAALYKKEGVNPLGGCLPMLLQFPIFIALYWMFIKHFDLRGATFIPGWITDLSTSESIYSFAPLSLPFLGSELHLLPFLMVGTQILTTKITQANAAQSSGQMKFMTYGLPLFLFFVLYNMPSGLLLYWTVSNLLTMFQQMYFNHKKQEK